MNLENLDSDGWKKIKTENGNFLVKSPEGDVFYTDPEGNYLNGTEEPNEEWEWAKSTWNNPSVETPDLSFVTNIKNQLKYIT